MSIRSAALQIPPCCFRVHCLYLQSYNQVRACVHVDRRTIPERFPPNPGQVTAVFLLKGPRLNKCPPLPDSQPCFQEGEGNRHLLSSHSGPKALRTVSCQDPRRPSKEGPFWAAFHVPGCGMGQISSNPAPFPEHCCCKASGPSETPRQR